jgi:hypothetical protein
MITERPLTTFDYDSRWVGAISYRNVTLKIKEKWNGIPISLKPTPIISPPTRFVCIAEAYSCGYSIYGHITLARKETGMVWTFTVYFVYPVTNTQSAKYPSWLVSRTLYQVISVVGQVIHYR